MKDRQRREIQTALEQPLTWNTIATTAWQAFQKSGAGCLLIHEFPPKEVEYISRAEGLAFLKTNGIDSWVDKYDPTKEVIICVLHSGVDQVYCYRLSQAPYPLQTSL